MSFEKVVATIDKALNSHGAEPDENVRVFFGELVESGRSCCFDVIDCAALTLLHNFSGTTV